LKPLIESKENKNVDYLIKICIEFMRTSLEYRVRVNEEAIIAIITIIL